MGVVLISLHTKWHPCAHFFYLAPGLRGSCAMLAFQAHSCAILAPTMRGACASGAFLAFLKNVRKNVDAEHPKYGARKFHAKRLFRTGKAVAAAAAAPGRQLRSFTTDVSKVIGSLLFGLPPRRSEDTKSLARTAPRRLVVKISGVACAIACAGLARSLRKIHK